MPEIKAQILEQKWDIVLIDEAHNVAKPHQVTAEQKVKMDRWELAEAISKKSRHLLLLTATPHNGYTDTYASLIRMLDVGAVSGQLHEPKINRDIAKSYICQRRRKDVEEWFKKSSTEKSPFPERDQNEIYRSLSDAQRTSIEKVDELGNYILNVAEKESAYRKRLARWVVMHFHKRSLSSPRALVLSLQNRLGKYEGKKKISEETEEDDAGITEEDAKANVFDHDPGEKITDEEAGSRSERITFGERETQETEVALIKDVLEYAKKVTPAKDNKLQDLLDNMLLERLKMYPRVIIFTRYKDTLDYLEGNIKSSSRYKGIPIITIDGSLNESQRKEKFRNFEMSKTAIMIATDSVPTYAWSNGGYSTDINNPVYGTHDFILEKAINMLPSEMKNKININIAYYGSETPDCYKNIYCIGDVASHHVYYYSNESVQADSGAVRAREEYDLAKSYLQSNDTYNFSLHLGAMSHYISDLSVFGHTMGAKTDWGAEVHHSAYESYMNNHLSSFGNVVFDGNVENIDAYNTTLKLAKETTFDAGIYTNKWMDANYGWTNSLFTERTQSLINSNANILSDTIYSLMIENIPTDSVSNLTNVSSSSYYINWTWTDPSDPNFDKVQIYINNKYKTSVLEGIQYYKAKKLYANRSYTLSTRTIDKDGNASLTWKNNTAWTNTDFEPPMRVTKLKNVSYASSYINWTWKDPKDIDFKKVMVFIDNNFKKNVSKDKRYYNATDFKPNTKHTISTWTVDINGNINKTWTNRSAWTAK
jgi:hypothetical protein